MSVSCLTFDIVPNNDQNFLGVEVWINDHCCLDTNEIKETQSIVVEVNDDDQQQHQLKIVIKNKTPAHTVINEQNEIVSDSTLDIVNFKLDNIEINQLIRNLAVYRHNFNGSGEWVENKFYNNVGCNGTVTLDFSTPTYVWLLEHM